MKIKFKYIAWLLPAVILTACGKDNYESPQSELQGKIVYQESPINVSYDNVTFELWQSGFGKMTPINVTVAQDGSYSALLFDGDYKLVIPNGQGPFVSKVNSETNSDTVLVHLQGDQELNIEVMPYYLVQDPQFSMSADSTVSASCGLQKVITGDNARDVQNVSLYISKTAFVDSRTSISSQTKAAADITDMNNVNLSTKVPAMTPSQDYVFARIGVKVAGVEDKIYSAVKKLQLK